MHRTPFDLYVPGVPVHHRAAVQAANVNQESLGARQSDAGASRVRAALQEGREAGRDAWPQGAWRTTSTPAQATTRHHMKRVISASSGVCEEYDREAVPIRSRRFSLEPQPWGRGQGDCSCVAQDEQPAVRKESAR